MTLCKARRRGIASDVNKSQTRQIVKVSPILTRILRGKALSSHHLKAVKLALIYQRRSLDYIITAYSTQLSDNRLFRKSSLFHGHTVLSLSLYHAFLIKSRQECARWGTYRKAGKRIIYIGGALFAFQPTVEKSRLSSYC